MTRTIRLTALLLVLCPATASWAADPRELSWDELIPPGAMVWPEEQDMNNPDAWASPVPGAVVKELDGQQVRIPGFIVPLESDEGGLLAEFFLVPYFGACIHVPPPPPNQIVYVTVDPPFNLASMWEPFWIEGEMRTKGHTTVLGATAYSLTASKIEPYEY